MQLEILHLSDIQSDIPIKSEHFTGTLTPPDADISLNTIITFENRHKIKVVNSKLFVTKVFYLSKTE